MPRRILFRVLGVGLFTWLGFSFYPGHTYLQAETQLTVPMLQRLENPGFLSRDLVATYPNLEYTVYDEATLFLNEVTGVSIENALLGQQIVCRAAGILGILLLAVSAGLAEPLALFVAVCVNLGGTLAGPNVMLVEWEAIPRALAWGLVLLAMGLLAREKPLLAGLVGGTALIYEPAITAPFWLLCIAGVIVDRRLRRLFRPTLTILGVFVLLLANLAQLQPGRVEQQSFFSRIPEAYAELQHYRTPYDWVSLWPPDARWSYVAVWVCGIWAITRIWPALNRQARLFLIALPACGLLSIPFSYLLLDKFQISWAAQVQPTRWLLFTICLSAAVCGIAGVRAAQKQRYAECTLWFLIVFAVPLRAEILEFLLIDHAVSLGRFAIVGVLACLAALILIRSVGTKFRALVLAAPLAAVAMFRLPALHIAPKPQSASILELATWVKQNTWGSSMFLFPDLGPSLEPGVFRARSERALWIDWNSGRLVPYFESLAVIWWDRWQQTMQPGYSPQRLQVDLSLPIDYYVLTRADRLSGVKPVFANTDFVVYDANDLRNISGPLKSALSN